MQITFPFLWKKIVEFSLLDMSPPGAAIQEVAKRVGFREIFDYEEVGPVYFEIEEYLRGLRRG